ncbi:MAG: hypothetical protein ACOCRX_06265 [Candidatus Woesearchaeota archaeon]
MGIKVKNKNCVVETFNAGDMKLNGANMLVEILEVTKDIKVAKEYENFRNQLIDEELRENDYYFIVYNYYDREIDIYVCSIKDESIYLE